MTPKSNRVARRRAVGEILIYGLCMGLLITVLRLIEYQYLFVGSSPETYGAVIAVLFAGLGIWLGLMLPRRKHAVVLTEVRTPVPTAFVPDEERVAEFDITPRELEILGLMAAGLSNREIASQLFVSENTVKTHANRVLDKLGAKRRTQAVRIGRAARLIP